MQAIANLNNENLDFQDNSEGGEPEEEPMDQEPVYHNRAEDDESPHP